MDFTVKTKKGTEYRVSVDDVAIWVQLERDLGMTFGEAIAAAERQSLNVLTYIMWQASVRAGKCDYKTQDGFIEYELDSFVMHDDEAPKEDLDGS